jgi:glycine/D-amino acid oxidase-like deaminating enzyme
VIATHSPILGALGGLGTTHLEISPRRTYALSATLKSPPLLEGVYWDLDQPYHYCRTRGAEIWVGGVDHPVGRANGAAGDPHRKLEEYLRTRFEIEGVEQRWSGQILETHDGLPLVGRTLHSERILVATGFGGNGISLGALAATQLCDLAIGRKSELASLLSPLRVPRPRSWGWLLKQNLGWAASRAGQG